MALSRRMLLLAAPPPLGLLAPSFAAGLLGGEGGCLYPFLDGGVRKKTMEMGGLLCTRENDALGWTAGHRYRELRLLEAGTPRPQQGDGVVSNDTVWLGASAYMFESERFQKGQRLADPRKGDKGSKDEALVEVMLVNKVDSPPASTMMEVIGPNEPDSPWDELKWHCVQAQRPGRNVVFWPRLSLSERPEHLSTASRVARMYSGQSHDGLPTRALLAHVVPVPEVPKFYVCVAQPGSEPGIDMQWETLRCVEERRKKNGVQTTVHLPAAETALSWLGPQRVLFYRDTGAAVPLPEAADDVPEVIHSWTGLESGDLRTSLICCARMAAGIAPRPGDDMETGFALIAGPRVVSIEDPEKEPSTAPELLRRQAAAAYAKPPNVKFPLDGPEVEVVYFDLNVSGGLRTRTACEAEMQFGRRVACYAAGGDVGEATEVQWIALFTPPDHTDLRVQNMFRLLCTNLKGLSNVKKSEFYMKFAAPRALYSLARNLGTAFRKECRFRVLVCLESLVDDWVLWNLFCEEDRDKYLGIALLQAQEMVQLILGMASHARTDRQRPDARRNRLARVN